MTFHAILKIGNTLVQMLRADIRFRVLVATIASIGCEIGRMAGDAGDRPALAVI